MKNLQSFNLTAVIRDVEGIDYIDGTFRAPRMDLVYKVCERRANLYKKELIQLDVWNGKGYRVF